LGTERTVSPGWLARDASTAAIVTGGSLNGALGEAGGPSLLRRKRRGRVRDWKKARGGGGRGAPSQLPPPPPRKGVESLGP